MTRMSDKSQSAPSGPGLLIDRRRLLASAGGLALATATGTGKARAQARDRIVFALSTYPPSLRPWANTGTAAVTVKLQTMRGLLSYDHRGEVRGELAESWRSDGPLSWTFKLRSGAKFQDGEAVDAEAVKVNFERMRDEKAQAYFRARLTQLIDKIETPDGSTVRLVLKEPSATLPLLLASPHMPLISPKSTEANPVGAGPYRITDTERGTRIDLEAFDGYWRQGRPATKKLRIVVYKDESLRVAALEAGDVDISEYVPWQNMAAIEKNPALSLDAVDGPFMYLMFNVKSGPFTNAKLRQAVAYAVNREDIVKAAFFGRGSPLYGLPVPAAGPFHDPALAGHWKMDVAKAKALLAEAGQGAGFKTTLLSSSTYGMHKDTAEVIQQSLKAIGIEVTLAVPDWATRVNLGNRGQYEFAVSGSAGDFNDPDLLSSFLAGGQSASYARPFGYQNPKVDELLAKGRAELDVAKRKAIYADLQRAAMDDAALVGLAWRSQGYGLKRSVKGFKNLPGALTFFSGITLEDVALG